MNLLTFRSFKKVKFYTSLSFLFFFIKASTLLGQDKITLSGYISDIENNETLIGVSIIFPELKYGTITNEYGFYSLTLPKGSYQLQISYLGFENQILELELDKDLIQNYKLIPQAEVLDEVIVEENVELLNIKSPQMSVNKLSVNTIKKIPAALGEVDIIKSITLLPVK